MTAVRGDWGAGTITLSWDAVTGAIGYEVQRGNDHGTGWESIEPVKRESHTFTGVQDRLSYMVRVRAMDGGGVGGWAEVIARVNCPVGHACMSGSGSGQQKITPAAPGNVTASRGPWGSGTLTVTWNAVSGADAYDVQRADDHGIGWEGVEQTTGLSHTFTGVDDRLAYVVRVRAVAGGNAGAWAAGFAEQEECPTGYACMDEPEIGDQTTTTPPGNNQQQTTATPPSNDQQQNTTTPPVDDQQQNTTSTPPIDDSQQTTTSTPPVDDSQQTTASTPPVDDQQQTTTSTPVGGQEQVTQDAPIGGQEQVTQDAPVGGQGQVTQDAPVGGQEQLTQDAPVGNQQQVVSAAPANVTAVRGALGSESLTVSWDAVEGADAYEVQRSHASGNGWQVGAGTTGLSHTFFGVEDSLGYGVRVRAIVGGAFWQWAEAFAASDCSDGFACATGPVAAAPLLYTLNTPSYDLDGEY